MAKKQRGREITILVDMDGVLAEMEGHFLEQFRQKWPERPFVEIEDRTHRFLEHEEPYTFDDVCAMLDTKGFFLDLPVIDGAKEALDEMSKMPGVNVFICSSPWMRTYEWSTGEKYEWVKKYLGESWLKKIILTSDKTVVKGDILIDDAHKITGAEKNPTWEHVIFTAGHNRHVQGLRRQDGWRSEKKTWRDIVNELRDNNSFVLNYLTHISIVAVGLMIAALLFWVL